MQNFPTFRAPETIIYGKGSFVKVGAEAALRGKKALIITDKIMEGIGNVTTCQKLLEDEGVSSVVFNGVNTEPTDEFVEQSLACYKENECDLIISLGGGSCIDTAKAVSVLVENGGYIGDYVGGRKKIINLPVPHIAIPTTAGTGSEATDVTIIINTSNSEKLMIKQPGFMPAVAIVDSALSVSSPKTVTAATGIDALSHAIEAYLSKKAHPLTDTLALSAMKLIVHNLKRAYVDGNDIEAREAMSLGALQAGMAFSNASVCLVHGMSRPIGALFHVPHGISNAMLLPAVLEFSKGDCIRQLADLGRIFSIDAVLSNDEAAAEYAIAEVKKICLDLNVPNLKGYGIDEDKFENAIDKMSADALKSGSPANNPRVPTKEEIEELYRICYVYQFE